MDDGLLVRKKKDFFGQKKMSVADSLIVRKKDYGL